MGFCDNMRKASLPVYILVMMFAMSTWIDIVGIWVEMPLMVQSLPEQWNLPAYLTVIIQCANVGPALYAIIDKIRSNKRQSQNQSHPKPRKFLLDPDVILTFVIIAVAILSVFLMSFFWSKTMFVFGAERSVAFMVLVLFSALVSCSSSVIFLPYMARFKPIYIPAYYIGQGLCGLVPGLVGLVQGVGKPPLCVNTTRIVINTTTGMNETDFVIKAVYPPPLFSVDAFFRFLTLCLCFSAIAFFCMNFWRRAKKEMVDETPYTDMKYDEPEGAAANDKSASVETTDSNEGELNGLLRNRIEPNLPIEANQSALDNIEVETKGPTPAVKKPIDMKRVSILLVTIGIVSAMTNGILPATQSYTCLPFGSITYTLSIRLSSVASPLASLSSMFLPKPRLSVVVGLTVAAVSISVFHLCLAAQSPNPVMKGQLVGEIIVIVTSVVMASLYSFIRVSVAAILREEGSRRELLWCGGITQIGSFCGAVVTFVLVSMLHVFQSEKPCR